MYVEEVACLHFFFILHITTKCRLWILEDPSSGNAIVGHNTFFLFYVKNMYVYTYKNYLKACLKSQVLNNTFRRAKHSPPKTKNKKIY
jgi:hypothetical protein